MEIRLQKIVSAAGIASRRAAERLIVEGRVSVNGETVRELGTKADPERDDVRVDGRRVGQAAAPLYLLLNKPRGYVTTRSDPEGRPTVLTLLTGIRGYVYPVGRLDYDSEGLLLLTNDGELAARLTHPSHEVPREYHARVLGIPDQHDLHRLARGIVLDGRRTAPAEVRLLEGTPHSHRHGEGGGRRGASRPPAPVMDRRPAAREPQGLLSITLHEGRTRQVRRMCEAIGHPVLDLHRVRIGPISDDRLKLGTYRLLTAKEVAALKKAAHHPTAPACPSRTTPGSTPRPSSPGGPPRRG